MILRIVLVLFLSFSSAICYVSGYTRLMSGLLVLLGSLVSLFFGLVFWLPRESTEMWFPGNDQSGSILFFCLAFILCCLSLVIVFVKKKESLEEPFNVFHLHNLLGGFICQIVFLFLSSYFCFPSAARIGAASAAELSRSVVIGTGLYLFGCLVSLLLFFRASRGTLSHSPDLMCRIVLALFAFFHCDKIPILVAYLLVYSSETGANYPKSAALALSAYIPVAVFFYLVCRKTDAVT